jgi:hypothetical protein
MTTRTAEPSATDVYALGRDPGESARLQRQSEELRPGSTALPGGAGVGPGQSAIDLQVVTMRDGRAAFAATLLWPGQAGPSEIWNLESGNRAFSIGIQGARDANRHEQNTGHATTRRSRDQLWPASIGCRSPPPQLIAWKQLLGSNCWDAINSVRGNRGNVVIRG